MTQEDNLVKILFRYYSDVLEDETVEPIWATIVDESQGLYKLDNILFYGPPVACDDIIFAEYDELEKMLTDRKTVKHSGNSVIQVVLLDKSQEINEIRNLFDSLGCESEKLNDGYFVMDVPAEKEYLPIKESEPLNLYGPVINELSNLNYTLGEN